MPTILCTYRVKFQKFPLNPTIMAYSDHPPQLATTYPANVANNVRNIYHKIIILFPQNFCTLRNAVDIFLRTIKNPVAQNCGQRCKLRWRLPAHNNYFIFTKHLWITKLHGHPFAHYKKPGCPKLWATLQTTVASTSPWIRPSIWKVYKIAFARNIGQLWIQWLPIVSH